MGRAASRFTELVVIVEQWNREEPGVLQLPSGRRIRGRRLKDHAPPGPTPTFSVYLAGRPPPEPPWEREWVRWGDFWPPSDPDAATRVLRKAYERADSDRVEMTYC
jgi:hypothetical protein